MEHLDLVVVTVITLISGSLCSLLGAVTGTTLMRFVFGRSTPGEVDFEAFGVIGGSVSGYLITMLCACLCELPAWVLGPITACSMIVVGTWYRVVCVSWSPEVRALFRRVNCRKCGVSNFVNYSTEGAGHSCHECGCDVHPVEELPAAPVSPERR